MNCFCQVVPTPFQGFFLLNDIPTAKSYVSDFIFLMRILIAKCMSVLQKSLKNLKFGNTRRHVYYRYLYETVVLLISS